MEKGSTINQARTAAKSADSAERNIENIIKDLVSLHTMTLFHRYDAVLANRQNCPPEQCSEREQRVRQLDRYYRYVVSQDQPYLSGEEKEKLNKLWCGNIPRIFFYYESHSSIDALAEDFFARCGIAFEKRCRCSKADR